MYCRYCGAELLESSIFCHKCGRDATGQLSKREIKAIEKTHKKEEKEEMLEQKNENIKFEELEYYTTEDVAKFLKCSLPTARATMKRADFPLLVVGKNFRVEKSAFRAWSRDQRFK